MTNSLALALDNDALEDLRAEVQAHRDGIGHLAEDPMHAGQPVHMEYRQEDGGEAHFWLQVTHAGLPLWSCMCCSKVTIGPADGSTPKRCAGCEHGTEDDLSPVLYEATATCRSWTKSYGGQYDGPCLIAGSDGCDCSER